MSNFAFLATEWSLIFESASKAESMARSDARTSCFYARRALELAVAWLYAYFSASWTAFQTDRGRDFSGIVDGVSV